MSLTFKPRKTINILEASDIHLFHSKTPTWYIVDNLDATITSESSISQADAIILAGDVYDMLQTLPSSCVAVSDNWIARLLLNCKKHSTLLIVLEGTPSHDRKQAQRFVTINELIAQVSQDGKGANLRYVSTLDIEFIEELGINVLYVPDEWRHDPLDVLKEVDIKLSERGLTQVDIAVMHGYFDYQVPKGMKKIPAHSSIEYQKRVKSMIFCGHVHEASQFGNILVAGSFDCIQHGSETKKGYYDCTLYADGHFDTTFRVNKHSKKYVTVRCNSSDLAVSIAAIERKVRGLPDDSHVRISAPGDNPVFRDMDTIRSTWPHLNWSEHNSDIASSENVKVIASEMPEGFKPMALNEQNIASAMMTHIQTKCQDAGVLAKCASLINETIQAQ